ncbi:MAG: histidine phosphatase family protein [Planctomycetales bacterium]|nr:histidine phosphatase family protein [Planctomycetales bacterium]
MVKIVLIRPGSTEFDEEGRIQGTLDVPLSEQGRREIVEAVDALRGQGIQAIYCSPCESAEESARVIAQALQVKMKALENLQNLDQGLWQGMLIDDVRTKQPKVFRQWQDRPENVCPPGGEMIDDVRQRVLQTITKLAKKHKDGVVGLVVPEPLANVIGCLIRDESLRDLWRTGIGGAWESVSFTPGVPTASP